MKLDTIQLRVKQVACGHEDRVEMEQLVYEECDTEEHKVWVLSNQSATVGVSLFLSDKEVEVGQILGLLFASHHQGGYPGQELCDGGGCLGREVDPGLVCQHPLPGQGRGQEHKH